jgi:hypothetical protein
MTVITMSRNELTRLRVLIDVGDGRLSVSDATGGPTPHQRWVSVGGYRAELRSAAEGGLYERPACYNAPTSGASGFGLGSTSTTTSPIAATSSATTSSADVLQMRYSLEMKACHLKNPIPS